MGKSKVNDAGDSAPAKKQKVSGPQSIEEAFEEGIVALESTTDCVYLCMRNPFPSSRPTPEIADVTVPWILENNAHLLLNKDLMGKANKYRDKTLEAIDDMTEKLEDESECANETWTLHVLPKLSEAQAAVKDKKWQDAFAHLLGMHLMTVAAQNEFIVDQTMFEEEEGWGKFAAFFKSYSEAWKAVLEQSDETLQLVTKGGKEGGYRQNLTTFLRKWELGVNRHILSEMDETEEGKKPKDLQARVRIFTTEEDDVAKEDEEESSDSEDSDDGFGDGGSDEFGGSSGDEDDDDEDGEEDAEDEENEGDKEEA